MGIWWDVFQNSSDIQVHAVLPSQSLSYRIFLFKIFFGHRFCDHDGVWLFKGRLRIALYHFETKNLENSGIGKKETGFIKKLFIRSAVLYRHRRQLKIEESDTGLYDIRIFHRQSVTSREGHT